MGLREWPAPYIHFPVSSSSLTGRTHSYYTNNRYMTCIGIYSSLFAYSNPHIPGIRHITVRLSNQTFMSHASFNQTDHPSNIKLQNIVPLSFKNSRTSHYIFVILGIFIIIKWCGEVPFPLRLIFSARTVAWCNSSSFFQINTLWNQKNLFLVNRKDFSR